MRTLVGLSYSPWTEKARWALDHHGLAYRFDEFTPMLGEPFLRARTRRHPGRTTVPMLLDGERELGDSFDIALYADEVGSGSPLFPAGSLATIRRWNELGESALAAGRALVLRRTAESRAAQAEALPPFVPALVRRMAAPVARLGIGFLARKYAARGLEPAAERTIAAALDELRAGLGTRDSLLEGFSYADITMAVVLQLVRPVGGGFVPLGPATRACWETPALAARFLDLVGWRDRLYARYRRPAASARA